MHAVQLLELCAEKLPGCRANSKSQQSECKRQKQTRQMEQLTLPRPAKLQTSAIKLKLMGESKAHRPAAHCWQRKAVIEGENEPEQRKSAKSRQKETDQLDNEHRPRCQDPV